MNRPTITFAFVLLCLLFAAMQLNAQSSDVDSAKITRWALISDAASQSDGLSDLLVAQLSLRGMELVERDEIAKLVDEQTLALLASGNVRERLRLGKLLHADGLIILRQPIEKKNSAERYQVILCECRQGARLGTFHLPAKRLEKVVDDMSNLISDRAGQFAGGLERIVAVAPFACLNIEHDYDGQGLTFTQIVMNQLLSLDGVAVLEVEEARLLAKEFGGGSQVASRRVPLFAMPSFRVTLGTSARFDIQIDLETNAKVTKLAAQDMSLNETIEWLHEKLILAIKQQLAGKPTDIPIDEQLRRLANRADMFERLGNLRSAIDCREALLLADSQNVAQRLAVLRHLGTQETTIPMPQRLKSDKDRQAIFVSMMNRERGLDHLSFLIHANLISRARAIKELQEMRRVALGRLYYDAIVYARADKVVQAYWDASMAADRQFVLHSARKILELNNDVSLSEQALAKQTSLWYSAVMASVSYEMATHACDEPSFRYFTKVVREVIPESLPTNGTAMHCLAANFQQYVSMDANGQYPMLPEDRVLIGPLPETVTDYLRRMKQSSHKHLRWYATWFELKEQYWPYFYAQQQNQTLPDVSLLDALIEELNSEPQRRVRNEWGSEVDGVLHTAKGMRNKLEKLGLIPAVTKPLSDKTPSPTQTAANPVPEPEKKPLLPEPYLEDGGKEAVYDRLRIKRLRIVMTEEPVLLWQPVSAAQDLRITSRSVQTMASPGVWTSLAQAKNLSAGCWDGRHAWYSGPGEAVTLIDLSGVVQHTIGTQDGLPPHDKDIQLFALEENRVLAFGKHGIENGCWLALLTMVDHRPKVQVFHEARRRMSALGVSNEDWPQFNLDTTTAFKPHWMTHLHDSHRDLVILGRHGFHPLQIDLRTQQVTVSNAFGKTFYSSGSVISHLPHVFKAYDHGVAHLELPAGDNSLRMVDEKMISAGVRPLWSDQYPALIEQGEWFIKPGIVWHRFRKDGSEIEQLVREPLPNTFHQLHYWKSAHYGIVSSGGYQFRIE